MPPRSVGAQWVLVRLHGAPLGFVVPPETGCSPQELRAIAVRQLGWRIASHIAADSIGGGDVSTSALNGLAERCPRHASRPDTLVTVAVCTRDRAMQLVECLDALMSLDYPHERLDLLVVDNAPVDASTRELVARYPRVRYVCETRPGLDRARNRAVHEARGDVIAFTDDDGSVDAGWVGAIATAFAEEPHAMCVTGLVVPDELDTPAQALFEAYGGFGRGFDRSVHRVAPGERAARKYGGTGRFGTGANMAFRRSFFDREGLFDPALDVGTPSNGGGDLEMFFRVLKTGHALVYEPAAIVRHRHRRDYAALRAQLANNGTGFYAYVTRTVREYPEERIAMIVLGVWWFSWWNVGRVLRSLVRPRTFPLDLTVAELRGSLAGLRGYFASRRQALRAGEVP